MTMTPLRRRIAALAVVLLGASIVLTACGSDGDDSGDAGATRTIKADYGETVEVPADPQRVAVLHPAFTEMFLDLGGKPVAVSGLSDSDLAELPSDQQAAYKAATTVDSASGDVDLEKLASVKPDVILDLTAQTQWEQTKEKLNAIAPTVPVDTGSKSDFQFATLAEATNTQDTLNKQKADFDTKVAALQSKYSDVLKSTKIVEATGGWDAGTYNINASMCAEVVIDEKVVDFVPSEYSVSFEQISKLADNNLILYVSNAEGQPTAESAALMAENAWSALPAVQSGHAQPVYCGTWKTYGFAMQYLDWLDKALATLPKPQ